MEQQRRSNLRWLVARLGAGEHTEGTHHCAQWHLSARVGSGGGITCGNSRNLGMTSSYAGMVGTGGVKVGSFALMS
jgi:hypothetical protein